MASNPPLTTVNCDHPAQLLLLSTVSPAPEPIGISIPSVPESYKLWLFRAGRKFARRKGTGCRAPVSVGQKGLAAPPRGFDNLEDPVGTGDAHDLGRREIAAGIHRKDLQLVTRARIHRNPRIKLRAPKLVFGGALFIRIVASAITGVKVIEKDQQVAHQAQRRPDDVVVFRDELACLGP